MIVPREQKPTTILLVEDEELICRVIRSALEARGYLVFSAGNADQATAIAAQNGTRMDLLITDVVLSGSTGTELADQLKAAGRIDRVLFMSGYDRDDLALAANAHFVPKPFTLQQLVAAVDAILLDE